MEGCEFSDGLFWERMKYLEEIGKIYNKPSKHGNSFYVAEKQIPQLTSSIDPTPKVNDFSKNALLTPPSIDPTPKPNGILTPKNNLDGNILFISNGRDSLEKFMDETLAGLTQNPSVNTRKIRKIWGIAKSKNLAYFVSHIYYFVFKFRT